MKELEYPYFKKVEMKSDGEMELQQNGKERGSQWETENKGNKHKFINENCIIIKHFTLPPSL